MENAEDNGSAGHSRYFCGLHFIKKRTFVLYK